MSDVIVSNAEEIAAYVEATSGLRRDSMGHITGLGVRRGDALIVGVVFEKYMKSSIEVHIASTDRTWLSKRFARLVARYTFDQLGCKVVFARMSSANHRAIAFALKLGFTLDHVMRDAMPDKHIYLLSMRRENCRYLEI